MKWTLSELRKKQYQENSFDETLDYSELIEPGSDFLAISPVRVQGTFEVEDMMYYHFHLHIQTTLTIACAITLKPVEVPLDFTVTETFSEDEHDEYRQVDGITVDLLPIIWSNIYLEKPLRVVSPNAKYENPKKASSGKKINPAFKDLEKYKR